MYKNEQAKIDGERLKTCLKSKFLFLMFSYDSRQYRPQTRLSKLATHSN